MGPIKIINSLRRKLILTICAELGPVVVVVFGTVIELAHIAKTSWINIFLYNSDSLTLALIRQSLAHKEKILWVFSAQLNLFPEGIFYTVSSLFTSSIRSSLAINAVINVVVFYVLIRLIVKLMSKQPRATQILFSLVCTLLLITYMLLETQTVQANQGFATYFLLTTYYYGAILIGLLDILLILKQLKSAAKVLDQSNIILSLSIFLIVALTFASNPLYFVQFLLPFIFVFIVLWTVKLIKSNKLVILVIPQLAGLLGGLILRLFLKPFTGQTITSHLNVGFSYLFHSFIYLLIAISPSSNNLSTKLRICLSLAVYGFCLFYALFTLNHRQKTKRSKTSLIDFFIIIFAASEPLVLALSLCVGNEVQQRYLIASLIIPIIGLTILINTRLSKTLKKHAVSLILGLSIAVITVGCLSVPNAKALLSTSNYSDEQCLEKSLNYKPLNGVADYWVARPLGVFNSYNEEVLQVQPNYQIYAWLNNLASYENKEFGFIVISRILPESENLPSNSYQMFGPVSKIDTCPDFYIYQFYPGTIGYNRLNMDIQTSLKLDIQDRQNGTISSYND